MTTDREDAAQKIIEYARNVDAIWNQPRADTVTAQATHAVSLTNGMARLREAIEEYDHAR